MNTICYTICNAVNMKQNIFKVQHSYRFTYRYSQCTDWHSRNNPRLNSIY